MDSSPLSFLLSYIFVGYAGVAGTYVFLRYVFPARRSPALWFAYFGVRNVVTALVLYALAHEWGGSWVEAFQSVWFFVTGCMSFLMVYLCFEGDFVVLSIAAVICDLISSVCMSCATTASNVACGLPADLGYLNPLGANSALTIVVALAFYLCLRAPIVWLLRWISRLVRRNRAAWFVSTGILVLLVVSMTSSLSAYVTLSYYWQLIWFIVSFAVLAGFITLARRARDMRRREAVVSECVELANTYDGMIRSQLEDLERGLQALEGHERALEALAGRDEDTHLRVRELQDAYRHLKDGAFCDRPALDAVLTACAHRLSSLGIRSTFTVAAVPASTVAPASMALALLNLACEAAERTEGTAGDEVELRVRGVGDQTLFRLAVPERWGALWAKRFLTAFDTQGIGLVRERREGERRVVMVVSGPQGEG